MSHLENDKVFKRRRFLSKRAELRKWVKRWHELDTRFTLFRQNFHLSMQKEREELRALKMKFAEAEKVNQILESKLSKYEKRESGFFKRFIGGSQ